MVIIWAKAAKRTAKAKAEDDKGIMSVLATNHPVGSDQGSPWSICRPCHWRSFIMEACQCIALNPFFFYAAH